MRITTGTAPSGVLQSAQHILFVEGATKEGLDVNVLEELVGPKLRVEPLGPSYSVRSVATALHPFHPHYWFVIDRDDWDDATIEKSWQTFPDPQKHNLLIWRRKELESYFLEPDWVCQSRYVRKDLDPDALKTWLAAEATKVLWLEAANRVLIAKRTAVKQCEGALFAASDLATCQTQADVSRRLAASPLLASLAQQVTLTEADIRAAFDDEVQHVGAARQHALPRRRHHPRHQRSRILQNSAALRLPGS